MQTQEYACRTCQKPRWTMMLPRRVTGHGHSVTTTCVVSISAAAICHDAVPRKEMYRSASPDGCGRHDVQSQTFPKARRDLLHLFLTRAREQHVRVGAVIRHAADDLSFNS